MLDFKNYNTWMYKFEPVFDNYDYKKIVKKFKNNKEVLSIHDITDVIGNEIRDIIRKRLHNTYDYIVFYHGTATNNIFSYLEKGLLPLDIKERNLYARKLFNLKEYPEITDDIFIEATKKQFSNNVSLQHREKRLFLTLDDNILKEESSHYLIYGGEHLLHLAQNLGSKYPRELPKKLKPLILKCRIPIKLLTEYLDNISTELIVKYFENIIYPESKFIPLDICICITTKIDADNIIGFEFPQDIKECYW